MWGFIMIEVYLTTVLIGCCSFFGGLVIKQDRERLNELEEKQREDGNLLHEIKGELKGLNNKVNAIQEGLDSKINTVITLIKNGGREI